MPLSIKNPKAENLANELAKQTGESITQTIIHALEDRLQKVGGRRIAPHLETSLQAISKRCAELPDLDSRTPDEILNYSKKGFFK